MRKNDDEHDDDDDDDDDVVDDDDDDDNDGDDDDDEDSIERNTCRLFTIYSLDANCFPTHAHVATVQWLTWRRCNE